MKRRQILCCTLAVAFAALPTFAGCSRTGFTASSDSQWTSAARAGSLDLLSVSLAGAQHGWAVGDIDPRGSGGAVYYSNDAGRHWQPIASTTEVFSAVDFVNPQIGWIAGFAGRIERTDDGGRTWKSQRSERGAETLNAICAIDERRAWAVGVRGLVVRTVDGGATWTPVVTGRAEDFWAVRFATPDRGWITGDAGLILQTIDGGANWARAASGTSRALYGLAASPAATVAVGESGTVLRSDAGGSWTTVTVDVGENLNAVAAAPPSKWLAVGARGTTIASDDGGRTWTRAAVVSPSNLLAVDLADPRQGVAVGQRGAVHVYR
jgi:photosystem II stability/assembly factor-like uncharacterized protein